MFTELIDTLRCPADHEDSWLVASASATAGRHIMEGRLGCPVCRATYAIVDGEVRFGAAADPEPRPPMDEGQAFRLAAQLHLVEGSAPVLLTSDWAEAAAPLLQLIPQLVLLTGDARGRVPRDDRVSAIRLPEDRLPLAAASMRGVALSATLATPRMLSECARVVRPGGRLVAPIGIALDDSAWRVLASDTEVQVAERLASPSAPVPLRRAPSQPLFTA